MNRSCRLLWMVITGLWCGLQGSALAQDGNQDRHEGVATCASSVCHGKLGPQTRTRIGQHEYSVWSREDRHAQAFKTLQSPESARIARQLGIGAATEAGWCLDCHVDKVPAEQRGAKFSLEDGVGCESCHGGAERWLATHSKPGATRADNLARGMYPTDDPVKRAQLCVSCHLGSSESFVSHRLLAAGHPRLTFELESFTERQPAHYELDDDYEARKKPLAGFPLWLIGQIGAADAFLKVAARPPVQLRGAEFALYDCFGCHHRLGDARWSAAAVVKGTKPGSPRLQSQHFLLLQVALGAAAPAEAAALQTRIDRLQVAAQGGSAAKSQAIQEFNSWLSSRRPAWQQLPWTDATVRKVRKAIIDHGGKGQFADYAAAEQAFMAVESLSYHLDDFDSLKTSIDRLFAAVEDQKKFSPGNFQNVCRQVASVF